jgi:hypothetical protein
VTCRSKSSRPMFVIARAALGVAREAWWTLLDVLAPQYAYGLDLADGTDVLDVVRVRIPRGDGPRTMEPLDVATFQRLHWYCVSEKRLIEAVLKGPERPRGRPSTFRSEPFEA